MRKTAEPQDGKSLGPGPILGGEPPGEESVMRAKKKKLHQVFERYGLCIISLYESSLCLWS